MAFIELLLSEEINKSENNVARLEVLRKWASKKDYFSCVALSKIIFFQYLQERQEDNFDAPLRNLQLLVSPCQYGYPVAIRFYNEMMKHLAELNVPNDSGKHIDESHIAAHSLYDL